MLKGLKNYSHIFSSITNHKKIKITCKENDLAIFQDQNFKK